MSSAGLYGQGGAKAACSLLAVTLCAFLALSGCANCNTPTPNVDDSTQTAIHEAREDAPERNGGPEVSDMQDIRPETTVAQIEAMPEFAGFGHLVFPVDRPVNETATLSDLADNGTYVWYSNLRADVFASALSKLKGEADAGEQIFFPIYSDAEIAQDPSKADTGLFFFRGEPGAPFAIVNAGGGFAYVAAFHDSFPQANEISDAGLNAFALIYRPDDPYADLARAIAFIYDNAADLDVAKDGYSLWGGSAGARMAATLGNQQYLRQLTGRSDLPQAAAVVMQYTGYSATSPYDAPTYINVGTNDGIANWRTMQSRADALQRQYGIPTVIHVYDGLSHGFGTGKGTIAQGWTDDAIAFWRNRTR